MYFRLLFKKAAITVAVFFCLWLNRNVSDNDTNKTDQKNDIRVHARAHRKSINVHKDDSDKIFDSLKPYIRSDTIIASYWSMGHELDTLPIMNAILDMGVKCALPVIQPETKVLKFAQWARETIMTVGAFDIPVPETKNYITPNIVLVPLLVFDQKGYRLGYGGGYYDATLNALRASGDVTAVGIGYSDQACLFALPREAHDERLDMAITPDRVYRF